MRRVGELSQEATAQRLVDYLLTQKISATVRSSSEDRWAVWVHSEDDMERASAEFTQFLDDPDAPRYLETVVEARAIRRQQEHRERERRKLFRDASEPWTTGFWQRCRVGSACFGLCLLIFLVFNWRLLDGVVPGSSGLSFSLWVYSSLALNPIYDGQGKPVPEPTLAWILRGQVWRCVTPNLMHVNLIHLGLNMLVFVYLSRVIEPRRGRLGFLAVILMTGVGTVLGSHLLDSTRTGIGMSGIVYGLIGYAWIKMQYDPGLNIGIHPRFFFLAIIYLLLGFQLQINRQILAIDDADVPIMLRIDNFGHLSGLFTGFLVGCAGPLRDRLRQPHS